jgi:hypothetical protein
MRNPINVLYYPDFYLDQTTLMTAILLFDELHFMDRPALTFGGRDSAFGTMGADSPLRQFEESFRKEGVPLFVQPAPTGPVSGEWYEQITEDVNDFEFLRRFQSGLRTSPTFRDLELARSEYRERLVAVDLSTDLKNYQSPMSLFEDSHVPAIDLSTTVGCAKHLV